MNLEMDQRSETCPVCDHYFDVVVFTDVECDKEFLLCYNCHRYYFRDIDQDLNPISMWVFIDRFGEDEEIDLSQIFCHRRKRDENEKSQNQCLKKNEKREKNSKKILKKVNKLNGFGDLC